MEDRFSSGKKVALLGIGVNIILLLIKLWAGYVSSSQAMIADGFNSMGDVFASTVTPVSYTHLGNKASLQDTRIEYF